MAAVNHRGNEFLLAFLCISALVASSYAWSDWDCQQAFKDRVNEALPYFNSGSFDSVSKSLDWLLDRDNSQFKQYLSWYYSGLPEIQKPKLEALNLNCIGRWNAYDEDDD